jgi:hypothetical protein
VSAVSAIARLSWMRLLRSRTVWASVILMVVPLAVAVLMLFRASDPDYRWMFVAELTFRSLVMLAPVLHLAPAVNEESDGKTYTYLWSRPVRREALLFGKLLAVAPAAIVAATLALLVAYGIVSLGPGTIPISSVLRAIVAAAAGVGAACCYALGIATLVPRHPLIAAIAYVFFAEQILPQVKAIQNLSTLYHVKVVAALPHSGVEGNLGAGLAGLAILSALWLGIAVWRIRRLEIGSAEG